MDSTKVLKEAMTAYEAVYNEDLRVELEEKQAFENWVNSLVEEGYDLSEYTWEDMYETYIAEMGQVKTTGQSSAVAFKPTPGAGSAGGSGSGGRRGSGSNPSVPRPAAAKPAATQSRFAGARDAAVKKAQAIKGSPVVGPGPAAKPAPAATTPATRSVTPASARPTAAPASKPAPTATAKPVTQPPESRSQATAGAIRGMVGSSMQRQASSTPAAKPTPTAPARPMGSRKPGSIVSGFDLFDVVKGHLLDEGYADTEEAALAIMANMSEEWRQSIIEEEQLQELSNRKLRAYVKKSEKSHQDLNKKWDQGTATYKDKYRSINRERGQERALDKLDKRSGK